MSIEYDGTPVVVRFPECHNWKGELRELELAVLPDVLDAHVVEPKLEAPSLPRAHPVYVDPEGRCIRHLDGGQGRRPEGGRVYCSDGGKGFRPGKEQGHHVRGGRGYPPEGGHCLQGGRGCRPGAG